MQENTIKSTYTLEKIILDGIEESNYVYMKYETPWYVKKPANCALWPHRKGFFLIEKHRYRELDENLMVLLANCFCKATKIFPCFNFDVNIDFAIDFRKFNKELCTSSMPLGL